MKILALEASAIAASAAVWQDNKLLGEYFSHTGKTHSQTLMPMTQQLLAVTDTTLHSLDALAVSTGPGSFTGLRIAIAAVKGMAMGADKPCVGVSTLEALAWNLRGFAGVAAAVMDARCGQVYAALFDLADGRVLRRTPDQAIAIDALGTVLPTDQPVFLVGDGAQLCYDQLFQRHPSLRLPPEHLLQQRAASVAAVAAQAVATGLAQGPGALLPVYLRLPQAQRDLLAREGKANEAQAASGFVSFS